jgi:hypothetical protein
MEKILNIAGTIILVAAMLSIVILFVFFGNGQFIAHFSF